MDQVHPRRCESLDHESQCQSVEHTWWSLAATLLRTSGGYLLPDSYCCQDHLCSPLCHRQVWHLIEADQSLLTGREQSPHPRKMQVVITNAWSNRGQASPDINFSGRTNPFFFQKLLGYSEFPCLCPKCSVQKPVQSNPLISDLFWGPFLSLFKLNVYLGD